jgi:hypothetical protein
MGQVCIRLLDPADDTFEENASSTMAAMRYENLIAFPNQTLQLTFFCTTMSQLIWNNAVALPGLGSTSHYNLITITGQHLVEDAWSCPNPTVAEDLNTVAAAGEGWSGGCVGARLRY